MIYHGDLFDVLPTLEAESIDACVTDPPYDLTNRTPDVLGCVSCGRTLGGRDGAPDVCPRCNGELTRQRSGQRKGFMGKEWDGTGVGFKPETWREVYRVLKPGAHLLAFGGTRTFHRLTCGIEDAGFEIRDCLSWLYGSGFPKSLNLPGGIGTALKPSWEPIILARKPLAGTVAANVQTHGTGAINIDACRIGTNAGWSYPNGAGGNTFHGQQRRTDPEESTLGRWPSNVLLDEDAATMLDEQTGELNGQELRQTGFRVSGDCLHGVGISGKKNAPDHYGDTGGASRFYYVAKPSREERDYGCDRLPPMTAGQATDRTDGTAGLNSPRAGSGRTGGSRNGHPTVKPVELMRWLVKLVTTPGGIVLDPFTGSGTTGMACRYEQRRFIGIEREADYVKIAEERIAAVAPLFGDLTA